MIILKNPELREQVFQNIRAAVTREREGIHLSDLIYCPRKAYFRRMGLAPEPSREQCLLWIMGYAYQAYLFTPPSFDISHPRESFIAWSIEWEGNISLNKVTERRKEGNWVKYRPVIQIGNTRSVLLRGFKFLVGKGHIYKSNKEDSSGLPCWQWKVNSLEEVKEICESIIPFLLTKKRQAELLLEYCILRIANPQSYSGREEELFQEMKLLNEKGKFKYNPRGEVDFIVDGIHCSPDVFSGIEVKSTRQSSKRFDLESMGHWKKQILGYCKALGRLEYDLVILFTAGNYAPPFPDLDCWHIRAEQEEIDANWSQVIMRAAKLVMAFNSGNPPEPDCESWEGDYCECVDLCPDTQCYRKKQLKEGKK